jgi:capsule polysaccharide export protein KpsE/RkpR
VGSSSGLAALMENFTVDILGENEITKRQVMTRVNSREIKEKIIKKFNLTKVYKTDKQRNRLDLALKIFKKKTKVDMTEEGGLGFADVISFSIDVLDKDSNRCSDIANYYVECIDEKIRSLNAQRASDNKEFIVAQMERHRQYLADAREKLRVFQLNNKIFDIPEQVKYVLKSIGTIKAQVLSLETQKSFLLMQHNQQSVEVRQINNQIYLLNKKILDIEKQQKPDLFLGLNKSLDLAYEYADLYLEVEALTGVITLLKQQFEQARIQESKNVKSIRIIDRARPPQKKYKPKRAYIVIAMVTFYMGFLSLILVSKKYYHRMRQASPGIIEKIENIVAHFSFRKQ